MGDERHAASAEPTAAADPKPRRGRDPDADRATAASATAAEVGVGDGREEPAGAEAATEAQTTHGGGLGTGPEAAGETGETATTASEEGRLSVDDLEFHALRGIRYHEARGAFLDLQRRILDFAVIVLGAGAVTTLIAQSPFWGAVLNVSTAAIGALQLVANLGDKAQEHRWARKKFCDLLARVTEAKQESALSPREMRKLTKRWSAIWGDEPTTMHVLEALAHNATARAINREIDPDDLIEIPLWRSVLRNWLAQEGFEPLTPAERRVAAERKARPGAS
jgi:hypothetical protein